MPGTPSVEPEMVQFHIRYISICFDEFANLNINLVVEILLLNSYYALQVFVHVVALFIILKFEASFNGLLFATFKHHEMTYKLNSNRSHQPSILEDGDI